MITKRGDSVATLHHDRDGGHHSNGTLEASVLRTYQLIHCPARHTARAHFE